MEVNGLKWRKSSFSASGSSGNCVEVAAWRKSSYSGSGNGDCVEVAAAGSGGAAAGFAVAIRDSKDPDGPVLSLTPGQWRALTSWVKAGTANLA